MSIRVLLPQPIRPAGYDYLREHGFEVVDGRGFTEDDIVADIADCDAIIVRTAKITARILDAAPKLKILARHGAGYDGVDLEAARRTGISRRSRQTILPTTATPKWGFPRPSWTERLWVWWDWATSADWWLKRPPWALT